ncbi:uncharacterized protein LOC131881921 [Tigriopus californicus]|nr:uncharacterized protein LOC131881921 [Tigriopus californicus]
MILDQYFIPIRPFGILIGINKERGTKETPIGLKFPNNLSQIPTELLFNLVMLKSSSSLPQLYRPPSSPNGASTFAVSEVDKAVCARAQSGGAAPVADQPFSSHQTSRASSGSSTESLDSASRRDKNLSRKLLREAIQNKRNEIKRESDRLNSSMTTPLCRSEEALLQDKKWMSQVKDLNHSFEKIPPISLQRKVCSKGQSYYVD